MVTLYFLHNVYVILKIFYKIKSVSKSKHRFKNGKTSSKKKKKRLKERIPVVKLGHFWR